MDRDPSTGVPVNGRWTKRTTCLDHAPTICRQYSIDEALILEPKSAKIACKGGWYRAIRAEDVGFVRSRSGEYGAGNNLYGMLVFKLASNNAGVSARTAELLFQAFASDN